MRAWLSWLFRPAPERAPESSEELQSLKIRRQALRESLSSLRAYGFGTIAGDDERALKAIERRILTLQHRRGSSAGTSLLH